jgi:ABC-2 type transport system ATP-binding protein
MNLAIQTIGIQKSFGSTRALDGLDLDVRVGEVHGFLGPNGSGKTTTLRVLLGLLRADGGTASVLGSDPWVDSVALHRRLAYVPGDVSLWPNLTGAELLDRFELDPTKKSRAYSKGNRQKVALIAALASDVELLLLDEPTAGLDPLMEAAFQDCIRHERGSGRTVLLSSHILAEAEALSDRVSIIRSGRIVETGSLEELRHLRRTSVVADLRSESVGIADITGVHDVRIDGSRLTCEVDADALDALLKALGEAGVLSLVTQPPTLEELFLRHYTAADTS